METTTIRQKLHQYIDNSDEKLLKMMFAIAKEYNEEEYFEYEVTPEEIKILNERRQKRLSGESTIHSWEDVKK
jgi:hypothetical protein